MIDFLSVFDYKQINIGSFRITYYAICILIGAILAYKLSQYLLKKRFGYNPEEVENLFYIGFPSGIIGARIWWVIAEWKDFSASHQWYEVFYIWEGGLAIQGGVLAAVTVGALFIIYRRKNMNVLHLADTVVPTFLLAQAIGRWGNFFNQEVYGGCVSTWNWLPNFITERLTYSLSNDGSTLFNGLNGNSAIYLCEEGQMVLPLFLIEGSINLLGFFILEFGLTYLFKFIEKKLNKSIFAPGDIAFSYLIWYGVVRMILEPLRNSQFTMGSTDGVTNLTSVYMSIFFVVLGVAGIIGMHIYKHYLDKKAKTETVQEENKTDDGSKEN